MVSADCVWFWSVLWGSGGFCVVLAGSLCSSGWFCVVLAGSEWFCVVLDVLCGLAGSQWFGVVLYGPIARSVRRFVVLCAPFVAPRGALRFMVPPC